MFVKAMALSVIFYCFATAHASSHISVDDIKAMVHAGVRISLPGERHTYIVPDTATVNTVRQIEVLDFSDNKIYMIPDWISKLPNLRKLDLSGTEIDLTQLDKLSGLPFIEALDISNNPLFKKTGIKNTKSLAVLFNKFAALKILKASSIFAQDHHLGDISSLSNLTDLDLSKNNLSRIDSLGIEKLSNLRRIDLSHNNISIIDITELPKQSIEVLILAHNEIKQMPFSGDLPRLRKLDLQGNGAVIVAKKYGGLFYVKQLSQLKIDDDKYIPDSLKKKLSAQSGYFGNKSVSSIYDENSPINYLPNGSVISVQRDFLLPKDSHALVFTNGADTLALTYMHKNRCVLLYDSDTENNRIIPKGTSYTITSSTVENGFRHSKTHDSDSRDYYGKMVLKGPVIKTIDCHPTNIRSINTHLQGIFSVEPKEPKRVTVQ